jgi:O-acetylhomoserine/O-acetylserine sulfhydrylase-like pyridoxal-dependent enzyme
MGTLTAKCGGGVLFSVFVCKQRTWQRAAGVTPSFIRLSVGIEDPRETPADLERALAAI